MKFLFQIVVLISMLAVSGCAGPMNTSSARAAYGDVVPEFNANKKKNEKRKRKARREAKRHPETSRSYFHGRPY